MEWQAAVGMISLIIAAGALLFAIFPGNRKRRLSIALGAFAIFVIALAMSPSPEVSSERRALAAAQKLEDDTAARQAKQEADLIDYRTALGAADEVAELFSAKQFTGDAKTILAGAIALNSFANTYAQGADLQLTGDDEKLRQKLKTIAKRKQVESLPILRDAYGPAMRQALWEADGKARTFGKGFRTVEFINAAFAANRNIKTVHEDMHATLVMLRFTRAQYKWVDADVEYQYYTMSPPPDDALVQWGNNGAFTVID